MRSVTVPYPVFLLFVFTIMIALPVVAWGGVNPNDPPTVEILDLGGLSIDTNVVAEYEAFTLLGMASGNGPLTYHWLDDDGVEFHSEAALFDHSFAASGVYTITLLVIDVNSLSETDSVLVVVGDACEVITVDPPFPWSAGDTVTINGAGFVAGSIPLIGGVEPSPFTIVSSMEIQATVPAIPDGDYLLSIDLPGGGSCELGMPVVDIRPTDWGALKARYR